MQTTREMLRHTLATVAYRAGKAIRGVDDTFAGFKAGPSSRTPGEILAHIGDLFDWALTMARGPQEWHNSPPLAWEAGASRFFDALAKFDAYLASDEPLAVPAEKLFQGPIADSLTHIGQINLLRRLAGVPVRGENYAVAEIVAGRTGAEQSAPRREFD